MDEQTYDSGRGLPRKVTPIGTVGAVGQLFTVYEKNWICGDCSQENYASRSRCFRCRSRKPDGQVNYVADPGLQALRQGVEIEWQEAVDPNSYQIYYYNKVTGITQWERPVELGPAPHATGELHSRSWRTLCLLICQYSFRMVRPRKSWIPRRPDVFSAQLELLIPPCKEAKGFHRSKEIPFGGCE